MAAMTRKKTFLQIHSPAIIGGLCADVACYWWLCILPYYQGVKNMPSEVVNDAVNCIAVADMVAAIIYLGMLWVLTEPPPDGA